MRLVANLEISFQIIEKLGKFYAMAWDADTMNLIHESEHASRVQASWALADFVASIMGKD